MTTQSDFNTTIKDLGYILPTPREIFPSYYRLEDQTVLKIVVVVNHLLPDPKRPEGFSINSTNIVSSFVPSTNRLPQSYAPYPQIDLEAGIIEDDMKYSALQEEFTIYDLSNGSILSIKPVLGQVKKTKYYSIDGEPIYIVNIIPIIKIKSKT